MNVQQKCDLFYEWIHDALQEIPYVFVEMTSKDKGWITPVLKHLIHMKHEAYRDRNYQLHNHYKAKVKREITKAKQNWIRKLKAS